MKMNRFLFAMTFALIIVPAGPVLAQTPDRDTRPQEREARPSEGRTGTNAPALVPKEEWSVTEHNIRVGNQVIPYKAMAGTTLLKDDKDEPTGLMYSVAYTRSDVKDLSTRPIAFFYNGGPGSATLWLHLGAFGPRRAATVDGTFTPPAPYKLVDNTESLIDKTDMVFIDAMGTGYSHAVGKAQDKDFYGIDEDVRAFGQFNVELQRSRGLTTGRIDSRFTGYTANLLAENAQGDPEGPAVGGAFTALINAYNHDELKFGKDKAYNNSSGGGGSWNWTRQPAAGPARRGGGFPGSPNVMSDLARALITNPKLMVQVENGYYDAATPFFATEYTMEHLGLPADLQSHIKLNYYTAGHMMYLHDESRVKLHDSIASFIDRATSH